MDPSKAEALRVMELPRSADELCQFVNCCRWVQLTIPNFHALALPLNDILERAYKKSRSRTKRSIQRILVSDLGWDDSHTAAFRSLQDALLQSVKLSFPKPGRSIYMYTDASQRYWSGVITQCDPAELDKPFDCQVHEPLAFVGAAFSSTQSNWSTFEKEGFAIYSTFLKCDYMLLNIPNLLIFTDHRNLLFIFAPTAFFPNIGTHIIHKVHRWAIYLSRFQYTISHIPGYLNIIADMLTRWTKGHRSGPLPGRLASLVLNERAVVFTAADITWPDQPTLIAEQRKYPSPHGCVQYADGLQYLRQAVWIPDESLKLQQKLLVLAHCGTSGHRGALAILSLLSEKFSWTSMRNDVKIFTSSCLHCFMASSGELIPRPIKSAIHGKEPNEVVHMDFLYMGASVSGEKYILLIRDDFSSYVWLFATDSATSSAAADAFTL